jgi:hypothetical protein
VILVVQGEESFTFKPIDEILLSLDWRWREHGSFCIISTRYDRNAHKLSTSQLQACLFPDEIAIDHWSPRGYIYRFVEQGIDGFEW